MMKKDRRLNNNVMYLEMWQGDINILHSKHVWEGIATGHTYLANCFYFKYYCGVINNFVHVQISHATSVNLHAY